MSLEIQDHSDILIELNKAVKAHHFYPQGHPNLESSIKHFFAILKDVTLEHGEVKWTVDQKGFFVDKTPVTADVVQLKDLAKKFFIRRIKEITVTPRVTLEDINAFLSLIKLEPEDIVSKGGLEIILAEKGALGILLNEMDYEVLKRLSKELEEKKEEEQEEGEEEEEGPSDVTDVEEESEAAEQGESEGVMEDQPLAEHEIPEREEEEAFSELISRIENEKDFLKYNDLSVRINERAQHLIMQRMFNEVFPALSVFTEHSMPETDLAEDLKSIAAERLEALLTVDVIHHLIKGLGSRDEGHRRSIEKILLLASGKAVAPLLDELQDTQNTHARRNIFNTLVKFGAEIREDVEQRLNDENWFVVRQMVALLGMLGDPSSLEALESTYNHPNFRVKREVLKTLARIPSPRSTSLLLTALEDLDPAIVAQAILSLGMLKDPRAVDALAGVIFKWVPFLDNHDQKKEAIKALGFIGDQSAVPYLRKLLFRKTWFRKKANNELRVLAANSLGRIGSPEALDTVEEALTSATGEILNTLKRVLEWRRTDERSRQ